MKTLLIGYISLILLTASCGQSVPADLPMRSPKAGNQQDTSLTLAPKRSLVSAPVAQDTNHIASDQTVERILKSFVYSRMWPDLRRYPKEFKLTPGTDNTSITDSIITYALGKNSFVYLKSGDAAAPGAVLMSCQLASAPTYLPKIIRLGMNKSELAQLIGKPFTTNVLLVSEQEGYQKFYFTFKNNRLQVVTFDSDYID